MATDTPDDSLDEFAIDTSRRAAKIEAKQRSIERLSSARADAPSTEREAAAASEREALQAALEALEQVTTSETFYRDPRGDRAGPAIDALRAALSRAPQAVRVPLKEEQIMRLLPRGGYGAVRLTYESGPYDIGRPTTVLISLVRAIEAAHGIVPLAPQEEGGK
jgi:hypothetical protein